MSKTIPFEQIVDRGCGIDVHKKVLVATIRGTGLQEDTKSFDSFTEDIEVLRDWLKESKKPPLKTEALIFRLAPKGH